MADTLQVTGPVALCRPRGAHRFEAFSPKLARRIMFCRRALLEQWLLLEANPKVITFCERPGYLLINEDRHLVDFWVRYVDREELVVLSELISRSNADASGAELRSGLSHRLSSPRRVRGRTTGSASSPTLL
jgi:hypothetical protein